MLYGIMGPHWRSPEMRDPNLDSAIPAEVARAADILLTLNARAFIRAAVAHTGRVETEFWELLLNYPVDDLGKVLTISGWSRLADELGLNAEAPFVVVTH